MKILHTTPTFYGKSSVIGGGEKNVIYTSRAVQKTAVMLNRPEIEVSILSFGENISSQDASDDIKFEIIYGKPWNPSSIDANSLIAKLKQADVIHVHQCLTASGLFIAAHGRLLGKYIIGTDHGAGDDSLVSKPEIGDLFDFFHAHSEYTIHSYRELTSKIELIKGPLDTDLYQPAQNEIRNSKLLLAVGRLLPHKGFDRIINALPDGLELIIIGSDYDNEYKKYLLSLSHNKKVKILEGLTDQEVLSWMQKAGLFIHASTAIDYKNVYYPKPELLGWAPLEAISTGLTTLVSDTGALLELASLPGCYLFKNNNELRELLIAFRDSKLTTVESSLMHNAVIKNYGIEQFGRKMIEKIDNLL